MRPKSRHNSANIIEKFRSCAFVKGGWITIGGGEAVKIENNHIFLTLAIHIGVLDRCAKLDQDPFSS